MPRLPLYTAASPVNILRQAPPAFPPPRSTEAFPRQKAIPWSPGTPARHILLFPSVSEYGGFPESFSPSRPPDCRIWHCEKAPRRLILSLFCPSGKAYTPTQTGRQSRCRCPCPVQRQFFLPALTASGRIRNPSGS